LVGVAAGVGVEPDPVVAPVAEEDVPGMAANQLFETPLPPVWPGAVSLAKVCSGQPLYVTSVTAAPLTMTDTVASVPVTPDTAVGVPVATTGGHAARHPAVQAPIVVFFSGRK
jgi:hypothetical protein